MPKKVLLAPPENIMVRCDNLVKIYKSKGVEVMALQGLDLTVERGELMGIVGASGSGKSTLLNMLGGLDKPSAGSLFVDGKDLLKFNEKDFIEYKRKTVGFVWQNNARNLIPYLTAVENVEMPMMLSGYENRRKRADSPDPSRARPAPTDRPPRCRTGDEDTGRFKVRPRGTTLSAYAGGQCPDVHRHHCATPPDPPENDARHHPPAAAVLP